MTQQNDTPQDLEDAVLEEITGGAEVVSDAGLRSDGELVQAVEVKRRLRVTSTPVGLTDG